MKNLANSCMDGTDGMNEARELGMNMIEEAKMTGMTPAVFTLRGR